MLADCVETTEVLQYQRVGSHVCSVCFASTPHTCWLNCDSSDTVGFTPHICKGNCDEPCSPRLRPPAPGICGALIPMPTATRSPSPRAAFPTRPPVSRNCGNGSRSSKGSKRRRRRRGQRQGVWISIRLVCFVPPSRAREAE